MNQHKKKLALVNRLDFQFVSGQSFRIGFFRRVFIYAGSMCRVFWVGYSDMGIGLGFRAEIKNRLLRKCEELFNYVKFM